MACLPLVSRVVLCVGVSACALNFHHGLKEAQITRLIRILIFAASEGHACPETPKVAHCFRLFGAIGS